MGQVAGQKKGSLRFPKAFIVYLALGSLQPSNTTLHVYLAALMCENSARKRCSGQLDVTEALARSDKFG